MKHICMQFRFNPCFRTRVVHARELLEGKESKEQDCVRDLGTACVSYISPLERSAPLNAYRA